MKGFDEWLEGYANVFGLNYPAGLTMLASWERVFDLDGTTLAELEAVTLHLATNDVPEKMWDHLPKLRARLHEARAESREYDRRLREEEYQDHACAVCQGTGYAVVPNLRCVSEGHWRSRNGCFYTFAVTCDCKRGEAIYDGCHDGKRKNGPPMPLCLREYHRRNPRWQEQLRLRERQLDADREARSAAVDAELARRGLKPPAVSAALERIRSRLREPGEE